MAYTNIDIINHALNMYSSVDQSTEGGRLTFFIALFGACRKEQEGGDIAVDIINKMTKATFDFVTTLEQDNLTPLMWAAARDKVSVVDALIQRGADLNFKIRGVTALYHACANRKVDAALLLIIKGADVNAGDPKPLSTIDEDNRRNSTADGMRSLEELLISKGGVRVKPASASAPRASNSAPVASNSTPDPVALEADGGRRLNRTRRSRKQRKSRKSRKSRR